MPRTVALIALLAPLLAVVGCGSSDDARSTTPLECVGTFFLIGEPCDPSCTPPPGTVCYCSTFCRGIGYLTQVECCDALDMSVPRMPDMAQAHDLTTGAND